MISVLAWVDAALYDALPYSVVTLCLVLTFKYLRFPDVTVSASFVLGGAVSAVAVVQGGVSAPVAIVLGFAAGALAGLTTALIHVRLRIEPIVASIISAFAIYAVNQILLRPTVPYGSSETLLTWSERLDRSIDFQRIPWHPASILVFALVAFVVKLGVDRLLASEAGVALRALEDFDSGEGVLSRLGISVGSIKAMGLGVGNGLVGLSGALVSMKEGAANLNRGLDILITGLIAYLLGQALLGTLVRSGRLRPTTAAIAGAIAYFGLVSLSYRAGIPSELTRVALAALVAVSVAQIQWFPTKPRSASHVPSGSDASPQGNSVVGISYAYPSSDLPVLDGLSLRFDAGRVTQLRGGNGAGKTTLFRLVAGQLGPLNAGRIVVGGKDLTDAPMLRQLNVRYIDQNPGKSVIKSSAVKDYLMLCMLPSRPSPMKLALTPERYARALEVLGQHGLPVDLLGKQCSELSGGEMQLVSLMGFLVEDRRPDLILLDEPLNGLDVTNRATTINLLGMLRRRGAAVVVVSHDPADLGVDTVLELAARPVRTGA